MATKKSPEGVGKKIVEALKKQSEIEITPIGANTNEPEEIETFEDIPDTFEDELSMESGQQESFENIDLDDSFSSLDTEDVTPISKSYAPNYSSVRPNVQDNFINELDTFEIPNNIAVLKKLITQLPTGVTRHTGAQIIKQTMEALGISMKSVLQEAQQVQEGLNNSANECYTNIQESKKQILLLEKQAQNYQRQYAALNELISLFVQTGM